MKILERIIGARPAKLAAWLLLAAVWPHLSQAQPTPVRGQSQIGYWSFSDTNWLSGAGFAPVGYSNIVNLEGGGNGNALLLDTTNTIPAFLNYNIVETGAVTNISLTNGSISFWFSPDWSSTNQGGSGPGNWGNFISLGQAGTNGSSWWSWYLSPDGCTIYFSSQTNGTSPLTYLSAPVSFEAGDWYNLAFVYSTTDSELYTNGVLVTNGTGVTYWPGPDVTFFSIGSDSNGFYQAQGVFDDLNTFNYEFDSGTAAGFFGIYSLFYFGGSVQAQIPSAPSTNSTVPVFNAVTGAGFLQPISTNTTTCTDSTNIWITNVVVAAVTNGTMNVTFAIAGGTNGVFYDVFANSALGFGTNFTWAWMGQGNQCVTYTITNLPNTTCFLILGKPQDTDQDGLTDAYEGLVTHTDPNNADSNSSGMLDGWAVVYGLNPSVDSTAQTSLRSNFTYDPVGRLDLLYGIRSETLTNDFEGNIVQAQ